MVTSGDIIEVQLESIFINDSNRFLNVFQYEFTVESGAFGLLANGQDWAEQWFENTFANIITVQSNQLAYTGGKLKNLTDPLEFGVFNFDPIIGGEVAGDALPPYASYGFLLQRSTTATRNGYKRFGGVPESAQVDGTVIESVSDVLDLQANILAQEFSFESTPPGDWEVSSQPVIVRKTVAGALDIFQPVNDAVYRSLGTQNSRKFGRGT